MPQSDLHVRVAVTGGGATGAMVAWHLLRARPDLGADSVAIIEPRSRLGAGQAYGTSDPVHRINVPAARMSIDTQAPGDFNSWLDHAALKADDPDAFTPDGHIYPSRAAFGAYLAARLAPEQKAGRLLHIQERATSIQKDGDGWKITTGSGRSLRADAVVIATSHLPPSLPGPLRAIAEDPRLIADPWPDGALDNIPPGARIAIAGTGLTMADIVASLTARGHHGVITAFSRRGLRSRGHAAGTPAPVGDFTTDPARTANAILTLIRKAISDNPEHPWQDVLDAARRQGSAIWSALPLEERRRLIRHLRPFWDVHRFRIAPQIEAVLDRRLAERSLRILAARIENIESASDGIALTIRPRNSASQILKAEYVINATGPDHAGLLTRNACLRSLHLQGLIEADPTGLGIHTSSDHRAFSKSLSHDRLFIAGPMSRGTFGELMGLPEVTANAESVARALADTIPLLPQHTCIGV